MKIRLWVIAAMVVAALVLAGSGAWAQGEAARPDGTRCFALRSAAPYTVIGSLNTDYTETAAGFKTRSNRNFRLAPGERQELCSLGPFYPGGRLELVLRSLVPLFSCYALAEGEIVIYGERKPEGGTKTWADCR